MVESSPVGVPSGPDKALLDALFSPQGRAHPAEVAAAFDIPGCRHAFVREVLHDRSFVSASIPASDDLMFQTVARFMARLPSERHQRIRSRFAHLFTPRRTERFRERITARVHDLIDELPENGPRDLVASFARPLPFGVIAEVLGVPADRHAWLAEHMDTFGRAVAGQREHRNVEAGNRAASEMLEYFDDTLEQRRTIPHDDLFTLLADDLGDAQTRADPGHVCQTHALLRGVEARRLPRCRRRRYNSGTGTSSALHPPHLDAARDERGLADTP